LLLVGVLTGVRVRPGYANAFILRQRLPFRNRRFIEMTRSKKYPFKKSVRPRTTLCFFLIVLVVQACLSPGTHGKIQSYYFSVPKVQLEKNVKTLLEKQVNLRRSSIVDSFTSKYYNDGNRYLTFQTCSEEDTGEYIIQFTGDENDWITSRTSEIALVYQTELSGEISERNGARPALSDQALIQRFDSLFIMSQSTGSLSASKEQRAFAFKSSI
jgi:hypothetical protein